MINGSYKDEDNWITTGSGQVILITGSNDVVCVCVHIHIKISLTDE